MEKTLNHNGSGDQAAVEKLIFSGRINASRNQVNRCMKLKEDFVETKFFLSIHSFLNQKVRDLLLNSTSNSIPIDELSLGEKKLAISIRWTVPFLKTKVESI